MEYILAIFWIFVAIGIFSVTELDIQDRRAHVFYWMAIAGMVWSLFFAIRLMF